MIYKISPITVLDNDHELFETHVGNTDMELLYSVWGKTEQESRQKANQLIELLELSKDIERL